MKIFNFIFLILLISACAGNKDNPQTVSHYSGWSDQVIDIADKSWKYAQLSETIYEDGFDYKLTSKFKFIEVFHDELTGYYAELLTDLSNNELVIVFRGSDSFKNPKVTDTKFQQKQNALGLLTFDKVRIQYPTREIFVTGHSLGGEIAAHVSLNRENVTAYYFNSTLALDRKLKLIKNKRYNIVGNKKELPTEPLFYREPAQRFTSINCNNGNLLKEDSMKSLADCLTQISAIKNSNAMRSIKSIGLDLKYL